MKPTVIETFSSLAFDFLDPQPEQICIEDIAHALSQQCRFGGHTRNFMSIAEHSWHVSELVPDADKLWGLLHDASESYIGDWSRPLKHSTLAGVHYLEIEKQIMCAICDKFDLPWLMPPSVKLADNRMLLTEKQQLMGNLSWEGSEELFDPTAQPVAVTLGCYEPKIAESLFLGAFNRLIRIRELVEAKAER